MYTHQKNIFTAGLPIEEASKAVIFLHGRGATAEDIIGLNNHLKISDAALFAPQATNNSWYPYSFMAPESANQPALDSALEQLDILVKDIIGKGLPLNAIYLAGFSQGACLTLEYITRHAARYGGAIAFTGGLIGETLNVDLYNGDFEQTPIWISTGDPDPHVPASRVMESKELIESKNGKVAMEIYPGRPHTITKEEIVRAVQHVFG